VKSFAELSVERAAKSFNKLSEPFSFFLQDALSLSPRAAQSRSPSGEAWKEKKEKLTTEENFFFSLPKAIVLDIPRGEENERGKN
jgi:hypothetical protein